MALTLNSCTVTVQLNSTLQNPLDLSTPADAFTKQYQDSLTNGTGANQGNRVWHDQRSAAAAPDDLDLAGSLTDAFGATVTFAKIVGIFIKNNSTTTAEVLSVGGDALQQRLLYLRAVIV